MFGLDELSLVSDLEKTSPAVNTLTESTNNLISTDRTTSTATSTSTITTNNNIKSTQSSVTTSTNFISTLYSTYNPYSTSFQYYSTSIPNLFPTLIYTTRIETTQQPYTSKITAIKTRSTASTSVMSSTLISEISNTYTDDSSLDPINSTLPVSEFNETSIFNSTPNYNSVDNTTESIGYIAKEKDSTVQILLVVFIPLIVISILISLVIIYKKNSKINLKFSIRYTNKQAINDKTDLISCSFSLFLVSYKMIQIKTTTNRILNNLNHEVY